MTRQAVYVPVLAVGKIPDFARDYLTRRRQTEGRFGESVETIDQSVELQRMILLNNPPFILREPQSPS
jgi:hypothetical protein